MPVLELTSELLGRIAGWQVMKEARQMLAAGRVIESNWSPPNLQGLVREGATTYRAGLRIASAVDADNLCSCRRARIEGVICAHSIAIGLGWLAAQAGGTPPPAPQSARPSSSPPSVPSDQEGDPSRERGRGSPASAPGGRRLKRGSTEGGDEGVRLHIIFPPNLAQALAKSRVMLVFEAERGGRRVPLNALPIEVPFVFEPQDAEVLEVLESLAGDGAPALASLGAAEFGRLLPMLADHPRLTIGRDGPLTVATTASPCPISATLEPSGEIVVRREGALPPTLVTDEAVWAFRDGRLQPLRLPLGCRELLRGPIRFSRARVPAFLSEDWPALAATGQSQANFSLSDFVLATQPPAFRLALAGTLARLEARLTCAYGPRELAPGSPGEETACLPDPASPTRYAVRDLAGEQAALGRLVRCGFTGPQPNGRYVLEGETPVLNFFAREFPGLQRAWTVTVEARLERVTATQLERITPKFAVTPSGEQWFDLSVSFVSAGGERFSPAEIQRLVLAGQSHLRLRDGRRALLDTGAIEEFQEVLLDCRPQQTPAGYRIETAQAGYLDRTLRERGGWSVQAPGAWRARLQQQTGEAVGACPPLGALESVLRPYQKEGVAWLWFLRQNGFGGILADEMGLGKTLQALAFLAGCQPPQRAGGAGAAVPLAALPHLVVCPTSLVFNWIAEAAKFVPQLRVLALQGPDRAERFGDLASHDLVVTSYALIRRDADRYRQFEFDTVILDEAQHIKNRATQNAQAVKAIRSRHRLVLTGTPLENSVLDLWSIFDFLMPGYLGGAAEFRERYEVPIARERDAAVQSRLARRVRPFLLRRLKADVAPDLPAKLEHIAYCELTSDQAGVYRQILEAGRREVLAAVDSHGLARSRTLVFTTLLRLRQVCCDLRLLNLPDLDPATSSAKLDLFEELLAEVVDGGHRALVFSQFTSMLSLIQERLAAQAIEFCRLDGATTDRGAVVQRFQQRPEIRVFLISLKAGGTGLNLTGADTVIHFDPWWNPAVENQATDRTHRLGQTRVVTSYKLVARGTVEEKILRLQGRKRDLIASTLGSEELASRRLGWEEIQELLA